MRIFTFVAFLIFTSSYASANEELINAARFGDSDEVERLLEPGSGVNVNFIQPGRLGTTALHCAARNGHTAVVDFLISRGADIELVDGSGLNALHRAAEDGDLDMLNFLISRGADIKRRSEATLTALHHAAMFGHLDILNFLILHGADIECKADGGYTAFDVAVLCKPDQIKQAIQAVRVKRALQSGDSALTIAIKKGNLNQIKVLLESGIEVTESDLQLAQDCKYIKLVHYLTKIGELQSYQYIALENTAIEREKSVSAIFIPKDNLLMIRDFLFGTPPLSFSSPSIDAASF